MARLAPAKPRGLDPVRRLTFAFAKRMYGRTLEPTAIIAHSKPLLAGYGMFALAGERFARSVDEQLKNLAMLRTAQLSGCEWCLDFGSYLARHAGTDEGKLRELSLWRDSDHFDDRERAVLEYAEAMTRTPVEVSDELFASLNEHFDDAQIVELTMAIAAENMYSRSNWAFGIEGQGFSDGSYCVTADRADALAAADRSR
jgi:AhpD family alkylhydroperoxidase